MAKRTSKRIIRFNKQNNTELCRCITLFCIFLCWFCTTNDVKMPSFVFHGECKQAATKFYFACWTWIWSLGIQIQEGSHIHSTKYVSRNNGDKDWENANSLFEQHSRYCCVVGSLIPSLTFNSPLSPWNIFKCTPPLSVSLGAVWV